jgi:hypothetical protein
MTAGEDATGGPTLPVDWDAAFERYRDGRAVRPLAGGSRLRVTRIADDRLQVRQRLWTADVTRAELEVALDLLGGRPSSTAAVGFSEELRVYYSGGPQVQPTCSRTPNLCAVVLADLGHLALRGNLPSTGTSSQ